MAKYSLDEKQTIDANLESFFDHLADANEEFAGILRRELPEVVAGRQDRSTFHASLAGALDATPPANEPEADEAANVATTDDDSEEEAAGSNSPTTDEEEPQEPRRYYLTELKVEGFRGINNEGEPLTLRFDADKVNSVYAENGFGKSSLSDALSLAIRGTVPTTS